MLILSVCSPCTIFFVCGYCTILLFVAPTTTSCIYIFEYLFVCSPSTFSEAKQFENNDTVGVLQMAGYMSRGPPNGSVYVCNLPPGTDETMLAEYFGTIGLLKVWVLSEGQEDWASKNLDI
jgi:hypothetical protein